jgi:hypothetical protein
MRPRRKTRTPQKHTRVYHWTTCSICDKRYRASRKDSLTCGTTCRQQRKRVGQLHLGATKRHAALLKAARKVRKPRNKPHRNA